MMRVTRTVFLTALTVAAGVLAGAPARGQTTSAGLSATTVVAGLTFPVSMAVSHDGTILVTEKKGTLRVVRGGVLDPTPVATFVPYTVNEAGLGGMTLAPDFDTSGLVIVSYVPNADRGHIYLSRVRLLPTGGQIVNDPWLTLPGRAATDRHYSGIPRFGPDGRFYVSLGDLDTPSVAQNPAALSGSLLRYEADLTIPADNPYGPTIASYAIGFRNPFGLDIGADGVIYIADNGNSRQDEVHRVTPGGNHGNPVILGLCDGKPATEPCADAGGFVEPIHEFPQTTGPTSVVAYHASLIPGMNGDVLVGGWHSRQVHRFRMRTDGSGRYDPLESLFVLTGGAFTPSGNEWWPETGVTDVKVAPDGAVLVLVAGMTSGTIYRLAPSAVGAEPKLDASVEGGIPDASLLPDGAPPSPPPSPRRTDVRLRGGCGCDVAQEGAGSVPALLAMLSLVALRSSRGSRGRFRPRPPRRP